MVERMRHSSQSEGMPCLRMVSRRTTWINSRRGALREASASLLVLPVSWNCCDSPAPSGSCVPLLPKMRFNRPMRHCASFPELEPHLRAGEVKDVLVGQQHCVISQRPPVQQGDAAAGQVGDEETIAAVRDG